MIKIWYFIVWYLEKFINNIIERVFLEYIIWKFSLSFIILDNYKIIKWETFIDKDIFIIFKILVLYVFSIYSSILIFRECLLIENYINKYGKFWKESII